MKRRGAVCILIGSFLAVGVLLFSFSVLLIFVVIHGMSALSLKLFFGTTPVYEAITATQPVWDGILYAILGSIELIILTLSIAIVPGIGCGIFLSEHAASKKYQVVSLLVDILAGTPSIVMGLFGLTLILFLRNYVFPGINTGLLLAAGCLALLVLPVLITTTQNALLAVPDDLRLASLAVGLTYNTYFLLIKIPAAFGGIVSGIMLALSRAAEDTAVILLTGVVINIGIPLSISSKFEALPFLIYYSISEYKTQEELSRGFGAAIVLLFLVFMLIVIAKIIGRSIKLSTR